ncbi:MAG: T9SS C-terminal target domain-containing protein [Bacteroidetes bacterium]|nr:MAG: T9SS C-terminal target domain-containing protein [Bacteroidota bacterium]
MEKKFYSICLSLIILSVFQLSAQNLDRIWTSHFNSNGDNSDRFNKVEHDGFGNYVAAGYTVRPGNYRDFLTIKFDSNGDTLWVRTRNGKGNFDDEVTCLAVDVSGNIYVAGYSDGGKSQNDILLVKYDANGNRLWDTTWNSSAWMDDVPVDMAIDPSGNILICGMAEPDTVPGSQDYITLKYSPNGTLLWQAQYSRPSVTGGKDEASAIAVDSNGDVYVTGRSYNGSNDDFITIKYNGANGSVLWTQPYNGGGTDRAVDVAIDNAGNVIVTGRSDNGSNDDFRILKYNSAGIFQWNRFYNGASNQNDRPVAIAIDASDNIYITGQTDVDNSPIIDYDFVTVKYNSAGTIQWARVVGGAAGQDDIPSALVIDSNGDVIITGKSDADPNPLVTNNDFMTVKYNSGGTLQWNKTYAGTRVSGSDIASALVVDNSGNVYVAGGSENILTQKDATVVKYDATGNQIFFKNNNGEGDFSESGRAIVIDANDRSYIAGYSYQEARNRDILLVALETNGDTICSFLYNGTKNDDDELSAIGIDASGNIYATGYTKGEGQGSNIITIKWNANTCDTAWTRIYNFSAKESDRGESLVVDAAGNVYVTGRSDSNPVDTVDNNDIVTMKYDTNGNLLWLQRYDGSGSGRDEPSKILLDNAGNVLVCGRMEKANDDDFVLLKYSAATGNPVWPSPALYNGPFSNDDRALDMAIDANNNIFICGYSQTGSGNATDDAAVVKFDPNGAPIAFYFLDYDGSGLGNDRAVAITTDAAGNVIVALQVDVDPTPNFANYNFLTVKFDNNLNQIWTNPPQYNGLLNSDDVPISIKTNAADIFVTGYSKSDTANGRTNINWVTIRYNSQGVQTALDLFDGPAMKDDEPNAIALRGTSLWVCGFSEGVNQSQKNMTVVRYDLTTSSLTAMNDESLSTLHPNPFSHSATLRFSQNNSGSKEVKIFSMLGEVVSHKSGIESDELLIERNDLPAGIYFYQVIAGEKFVSSGKFVIQN